MLMIRPWQTNDLAQALSIFAALAYDPSMNAQWFAHCTSGDPTCPAEMCLVACEGDEPVGFAVGCVRGEDLIVKFIAVPQDRRRHGVASALLQRLEDVARERGCVRARVGGAGPNYFYPGVDLTFTPALSFFWRHGYQTDRTAMVDMRVDLATADLDTQAAIATLQQDGLSVQRITSGELAQVAEFGGTHSDAWHKEVMMAGDCEPLSGFAAYAEDRPIAFAVYGATGRNRFGPTLTDPAYRQRGVGGVLLKLCLADLRDQGWAEAEISWAGPVQYYARTVGAVVHKAYWAFTKEL